MTRKEIIERATQSACEVLVYPGAPPIEAAPYYVQEAHDRWARTWFFAVLALARHFRNYHDSGHSAECYITEFPDIGGAPVRKK